MFFRKIVHFILFFAFLLVPLTSLKVLSLEKTQIKFGYFLVYSYLCTRIEAQMAESVDALVSNTSGATRAGSTPALGTRLKKQCAVT